MILYPKMLLNRVTEITPELLEKNNIKAIILDVDNTLINIKQELSEDVKKWVKDMKQNGTKLYILSNTNDKQKVGKVSKTLDIPYVNLAKKPFKQGFLKVQKNIARKTRKHCCSWRSNIYRRNRWQQVQYVYNTCRTNSKRRILVH